MEVGEEGEDEVHLGEEVDLKVGVYTGVLGSEVEVAGGLSGDVPMPSLVS